MSTKDSILGEAADRLNVVLREAEEAIRIRAYGVRAIVRVPRDSPEVIYIAFGKFENRWGLYLEDAGFQPRSLYDAPLEVRMVAALQIPLLNKKLWEKHDLRISQLEAITDALDAFVANLLEIGPEHEPDFLESAVARFEDIKKEHSNV